MNEARSKEIRLDRKMVDLTVAEFISVTGANLNTVAYTPNPVGPSGPPVPWPWPWPWGRINDPRPDWAVEIIAQNALLTQKVEGVVKEINNLKKHT